MLALTSTESTRSQKSSLDFTEGIRFLESVLKKMIPFVSQQEFNLFHRIDRELYSVLVINLWRDPVECIQVIALWLWLERIGLRDIVQKIFSLPQTLINNLVDEAFLCLNIINNVDLSPLSKGTDIPLMQCFIEANLSLKFFFENKLFATQGIAKIVNDVCMRALTDIMQHAIERNAAQSIADSQQHQQAMAQTSLQQQHMVQEPSLPPPIGFSPVDGGLPFTQANGVPVPPEDRTIFLTFSKGYPASEREVREFFALAFGDCIESLYMQEVLPYEQPLFARIVFRSTAAIEVILHGTDEANFTINGKQVWAGKFVPNGLKPSTVAPPRGMPVPFWI